MTFLYLPLQVTFGLHSKLCLHNYFRHAKSSISEYLCVCVLCVLCVSARVTTIVGHIFLRSDLRLSAYFTIGAHAQRGLATVLGRTRF